MDKWNKMIEAKEVAENNIKDILDKLVSDTELEVFSLHISRDENFLVGGEVIVTSRVKIVLELK